ncbi:MAG: DUF1512 family protein [Candidatus Aenigmatarchaeota archaeon]|nr:DUF1512 domain-containing protein [Candidatus Aenigmarchaeota archaeon]
MPLLGDTSFIGTIIWIVFFLLMMFFYPRIMLIQMIGKLESTALMLEGFTQKTKQIVLKKISKNPTRELREKIGNFMEFFAIEPVNLDPYGILNKLSHLAELVEDRFKDFSKEVAPKMNPEEQASLVAGLSGAITMNQIAKIVRHFVETVKKTKNLQLALVLQMQVPFIEKIAKAVLNGTETMTNGWPMGDSIGPMVASYLIGDSRGKEIADTIVVRKKIKGRNVIILKAKGPGGRLGKPWEIIQREVKRGGIAKIISIDAAGKLEGEKTGDVAEGIGVAMGSFYRAFIENIVTEKKIPVESIAIKMAPEEAIMNMHPDVIKAVPRVIHLVEQNIKNTKRKGTIIIMGVGNTSGVGNDKKSAEAAEKKANEIAKMMKRREEQEQKKGWFGF